MYRDIVETRLIASLHVFDRPSRPLSLHCACRGGYLRLHRMIYGMYRDIVETRLIASLHVFDRPSRPLSLHRACRGGYLRLHQMPMHGGRPRVRCGETRIRVSTLGAAVYVDCRACCNSYCARFALSLFHEDRMRLGKQVNKLRFLPAFALAFHYLCRAVRAVWRARACV